MGQVAAPRRSGAERTERYRKYLSSQIPVNFPPAGFGRAISSVSSPLVSTTPSRPATGRTVNAAGDRQAALPWLVRKRAPSIREFAVPSSAWDLSALATRLYRTWKSACFTSSSASGGENTPEGGAPGRHSPPDTPGFAIHANASTFR